MSNSKPMRKAMSRTSAGTFETSGVLQLMKKMILKQLSKINCRRNSLRDVIIYAGINLITFNM
jgi:hypothetical protein